MTGTAQLTLASTLRGKQIKIHQDKRYAPEPAPRPAVDAFGWDTVYAMRFAQINDVIRNTGASPGSFDRPDVPAPDPYEYRISGTFGDWRLATGGSGQIVCMELPIPALTYEDVDAGTTDAYDDVVATIRLRFEDLPQPVARGAVIFKRPGNVVEIRFPQGGGNEDVIDSVTTEYNGSTEPDPTAKIVINSLLRDWLNDNCQDFNMVFATINLNAQAGKDDFAWMMPTHVGYAVRDDIFAVLCMTEDRAPSPAHDVSPDIIPEGEQSGFLISSARYLQNVVLPNAYLLFDGASKSDFTLRTDGTMENVRKITLSRLETEDGDVFKPAIAAGGFTMRIVDSELVLRIENMRYTIPSTLGPYDIVMTTSSRGTAALDGTGHLGVSMQDGEADGMIDASMQRRIIEIAVPVVTSIALSVLAFAAAGAAAGQAAAATEAGAQGAAAAAGEAVGTATVLGLTPRVWALVGAIVGALGGGGWTLYQAILEERAKDKALTSPTLRTLLEDAVGAVQWPGGTDYKILSAIFNNGLQIGIEHQQAVAGSKPLEEAVNA